MEIVKQLIRIIFIGIVFSPGEITCLELTANNVDKFLKTEKFSLVIFYAPWQSECQDVIKTFQNVEEYFEDVSDVFIGQVNVYRDLKLASRYHVEDYCLVKYFIKGSDVPESYEGQLDEDSLKHFVKKTAHLEISEGAFRTSLIELNSDNFDRIIKDEKKTALVYFYAPWCIKCTNLTKTVKKVARTFQSEPDCIISKINGESNYDVTLAQKVGVYPTFMFYPKHDKDGVMYLPGKFDENWSEKNITKFMNVHCRSKHVQDGLLDKMLGVIDELDLNTRHFILNQNRRNEYMRETILMVQNLSPYKRTSADVYVKIMRQIIQDGDVYLDNEIQRIEKLLLTKMLPEKHNELNKKRNVLRQFNFHRRDEL